MNDPSQLGVGDLFARAVVWPRPQPQPLRLVPPLPQEKPRWWRKRAEVDVEEQAEPPIDWRKKS